MRKIRRFASLHVIALLVMATVCSMIPASAMMPQYTTYVDVEEPGRAQTIALYADRGGMYTISLLGEDSGELFEIAVDLHLYPQENEYSWNGASVSGEPVPVGPYVVNVYLETPETEALALDAFAETGAEDVPRELITQLTQSVEVVTGAGIWCDFVASKPGKLTTQLVDHQQGGSREPLLEMTMGAGPMSFKWNARRNDVRVAPGEYSIEMEYVAEDSETFGPHLINFSVVPVSEPYGSLRDETYWSMAPGETNDDVIWDILMQPITVFDNDRIGYNGHVYLKENPDGTGKSVAQIHGESQGLHVLGDENEYGYVLVEAFSNYDPEFQPRKPEELEDAFRMKTGFIEAKYLKTVEPDQHIGLVVDKLTQRLYLFVDGKRVTELVVSTGYQGKKKDRMYRETIAGEFITVSFPGGFWTNEIYSDLGIRYNGGSLLHEVPCTIDSQGVRHYAQFEKLLGTKASAGCVRIQLEKNPEGYNHETLFRLLKPYGEPPKHYKVIIWSDLDRLDTPETWYDAPADERKDAVVPLLPV